MKYLAFFSMLFAVVLAQAQPADNAPNPPARNAGDVISIFGESYTNLPSINYNPDWGQSGLAQTDAAFDPGTGNKVLAYRNFNYQGIDFAANPQNASAMEYLHIDIWTATATVVKISPIDNSGDGPSEFLVDIPLDSAKWSSIDLPKSAFTGMSWKSLFQMKFDGQAGKTPSDIYLDNIYFWKSATASGQDATLSDLKVDSVSINGFASSATTYTYGVPGGSPVPQITSAVTTDTLATVTSIVQATSVPGTASVTVTAADGTTTLTYTIAFFFNSPAMAAPAPEEDSTRVISLFSDAYTDVPVDTWRTSWSQAVYEAVSVAGNPTHKYTNVGFIGVETTSPSVDATNMMYLHLDVWTPNVTTLNVKLVSFLGDGFQGANGDSEANLNFELTLGEWNRLKIPLADFTAAGLSSLADLNQYIFTSTPFGSGAMFMDNVYFSSMLTSSNEIKAPHENVVLYPNPVSAGQEVNVTAPVEAATVYHLNGQQLKTVNAQHIPTDELPKGVYLITIKTQKGNLVHKKLIVQ